MAGSRRCTRTSPAPSCSKGDPLLTLYSPEMLASQKEYLLALKARDVMRSGGAIQSAVANSDTLIEARESGWNCGI